MSDEQPSVPYGFCHCGCGRQTNLAYESHPSRGWITGEPVRYILGHATRKPVPIIEDPDTHCWVWQLTRNRLGYGGVQIKGKKRPAHRVYYEELVGPIPAGLTLDHLCRNPSCVNPGHLEPVTHRENILRGEGWAAKNARKTHCKNGHPFDAENTRWHGGGRYCRACGRAAQARHRARKKEGTNA